MNEKDVKTGVIYQAKDGVRKIKILNVDTNGLVAYEPMVFGNQGIRYIKLDKLLENFKLIDER